MGKIDMLRTIQLELLEYFMMICEREGLSWYASHGTLLGAMREEGYLLWDDDIDLVMPADDFSKLMKHKDWFASPYYLQTPLDKRTQNKIRFYKDGTTAFDKPLYNLLMEGGHQGICIDILPLDEIGDTGFYYLSGKTIPKNYYEPLQKAKFEHLEINIPAKSRKILSKLYGYWSWPSGAQQPKPHNWFFDTETNYSVYINRYTGWLKASENKKIYLFGAGDSLRIWLNDFGLKDQVVCTYDNNPTRWGTKAYGVDICNPKDIINHVDDNGIIIIVSIWHLEIGRQLEDLGIKDYYVFLDELFNN